MYTKRMPNRRHQIFTWKKKKKKENSDARRKYQEGNKTKQLHGKDVFFFLLLNIFFFFVRLWHGGKNGKNENLSKNSTMRKGILDCFYYYVKGQWWTRNKSLQVKYEV